MRLLLASLACLVGLCHVSPVAADDRFDPAMRRTFIGEMERKHAVPSAELDRLFEQVHLQQAILEAIARPAESKPWHQYRDIFLTDSRIAGGVAFWSENAAHLDAAAAEFGVDPGIIVAIIGVETAYGDNPGKYRVIDALATLAFNYPKRATFFRGELENYLLLTRAQGFDPLALTGSYAGAMGLPQFMPSSYRSYAVDFDDDGQADIWANAGDAIGSVGNYLARHGWLRDAPITARAEVSGYSYQGLIAKGLEPSMPLSRAQSMGIAIQDDIPGDPQVALIELMSSDGPEHWIGFKNFYVITRYNHSPLYAMAVFQLAEAIREQYVRDTGQRVGDCRDCEPGV